MTSQDLVKSIDLTGLTTVTGSEMNQLIDAGRPASDKGFQLETTDTALNTPTVPNPDVLLEGIIPTQWKRYIWKRCPFNNTGTVKSYQWNPQLASDATYLKWESITVVADILQTAVTNATNTANTANTNANTAIADASVAHSIASQALTTAENAANASAVVSSDIIDLQEALEDILLTAEVKIYAGKRTFSTIEDQGWLVCDGSAVSRTTFSHLFEQLQTVFGSGDGSTTFNLPDLRGRAVIGSGVGVGLVGNYVFSRKYGNEDHRLLGSEMPDHNHSINLYSDPAVTGGLNVCGVVATVALGSTVTQPGNPVDWPHNAFSLLQPVLTLNYLIKT